MTFTTQPRGVAAAVAKEKGRRLVDVARNIVVSGMYEGKKVKLTGSEVGIESKFKGVVPLDDTTVESYEILWSERKQRKLLGAFFGYFAFIGWGFLGGLLLVPLSLIFEGEEKYGPLLIIVFGIFGVLWAIINSPWMGNYRIEIFFHNGESSVIEVDEKHYKLLRDKVTDNQEPFAPDDEEEYQAEEESVAAKEGMDILAELEAINDTITDEKMSEQIGRIRDVTEKILNYQEKRPEKAALLHSFLSYYLPATLKILKSYGELEGQGVSGGNITGTMERIEGMMDQIVACFEKQLDRLYQGEAMDIAAEVQVLERMMAKDGLTKEGDFSL